MVRIIALTLALGLAGCAASIERAPAVRDVDVPVAVRAVPPAELTTPFPPPAFRFIAPTDPGAVAALDKSGVAAFVDWGAEMRRRVAAWEAWAKP